MNAASRNPLVLYLRESMQDYFTKIMDDSTYSLKFCTEHFGQLKECNGGLGVISPRGKSDVKDDVRESNERRVKFYGALVLERQGFLLYAL